MDIENAKARLKARGFDKPFEVSDVTESERLDAIESALLDIIMGGGIND